MTAPRDGRTPQGTGGPYAGNQAPDPYLDQTYAHDPYATDPYATDPHAPAAGALYAEGGYPPPPQPPFQSPFHTPFQNPAAPSAPQPGAPQGAPQAQPYGEQPYPEQPAYPPQQQPYPGLPGGAEQTGRGHQPQAFSQAYAGQQQAYAPQQPPGVQGWPQDPQQQPGHLGGPNQAGQPGGPSPYPAQGLPPQPGQPGQAGQPGSEQYVGVDELISGAGRRQQTRDHNQAQPHRAQDEAYDFLFRDSGPSLYGEAGGDSVAETTGTIPLLRADLPQSQDEAQAETEQEAAGASKGKVASLLNSSAIMAAGTLVSRGTGFLRTMVIASAIGVSVLGDRYSVANTLPTMIYILVGGGALNAVFVPQLVRSMKNDEDNGEAYANRLLTLVIVGLGVVVAATVLAAPLLVRAVSNAAMSQPASADVSVALTRYCLPTIFFMGLHVVMGQILNARGKFGPMMWTPVLNNIVVIFTFSMFIWVYGPWSSTQMDPSTIPSAGVRLLGIGTLLGLVVQSLAMFPYLRHSGLRFRPRFDWRGHGLGHAAKLAKWTFLFVLANQAGFLVVTQLATAAGDAAGDAGKGLAAYQNALLIWQLPQAVITVSIMSAVLPRISRAAAEEDGVSVRDDLSYGLRTSAVAIVPGAFAFLALGPAIGATIYGNVSVGYMVSAFALGLIPFSAQYVLLRGFYAYEDTRTPFYNTVWVAATQAVLSAACYVVLPAKWAVTGMAFVYGAAYIVGLAVAVPRLRRRIGDLDGARIKRTYARLIGASVLPAVAGAAISLAVLQALGEGRTGGIAAVVAGGLAQLGLFLVVAQRMRIEELNSLLGVVRAKIGR
ncbi:murein biosynthesis integral membrane protein MurJ [Streptacidiphilus neutrinimicus]|uniref:murein biosynthesis integral membrane protein MurJ n=1 Tax=Streptacidiphilus neutrinimicus TaxID=105420 RepID=UPI0005A8DC7C|nr:murein biosynthesis integral membrane protein MurJ [Streptacidiphilus neutrinimicus]